MIYLTPIEKYKAMCLSFKRPPNAEFLNLFWKHIKDNTRNDELEIILKAIPMEFKTFPSIEEINQLLNKIRANSRVQKKLATTQVTPHQWVSTKAPGTPPKWEAIFVWIEKGLTETPYFKRATKNLGKPDEFIWEAYEHWIKGGIHPLLKEKL
jgi:hypothetical protein